MGYKSDETFWGENMTKDEYIEKIICLRSKLCQKPDDYTKSKVKIHNKAVRELIATENELGKDIDLAEQVYAVLIESEDMYIKQCAATACLFLNIHIKKAVKILEHQIKRGEVWEAMSAERQLKIWRGEISHNDPG